MHSPSFEIGLSQLTVYLYFLCELDITFPKKLLYQETVDKHDSVKNFMSSPDP